MKCASFLLHSLFTVLRLPRRYTLFPYTTLFRSVRPSLMLVDEPTQFLGPTAASRVLVTLRALADGGVAVLMAETDRKSTRLNSSHTVISYAVFCLKKKIVEEREIRSKSAISSQQ